MFGQERLLGTHADPLLSYDYLLTLLWCNLIFQRLQILLNESRWWVCRAWHDVRCVAVGQQASEVSKGRAGRNPRGKGLCAGFAGEDLKFRCVLILMVPARRDLGTVLWGAQGSREIQLPQILFQTPQSHPTQKKKIV